MDLSVLSRADAAVIKPFVDQLLPRLGEVEVVENRTGLVMLPSRDTAQGATFHLGEVLVSEARVRVNGTDGYGACLGRDLEQSLAVALLDAAFRAGVLTDEIQAFVDQQTAAQRAEDESLLRKVAATKVEMETF